MCCLLLDMAGWVLNQSLLFLSSTAAAAAATCAMLRFHSLFYCCCCSIHPETTRIFALSHSHAFRRYTIRLDSVVIDGVTSSNQTTRKTECALFRLYSTRHTRRQLRRKWKGPSIVMCDLCVCVWHVECYSIPVNRTRTRTKKWFEEFNFPFYFTCAVNIICYHRHQWATVDGSQAETEQKIKIYRWFVLTALKTNKKHNINDDK